MYARKRTLPGAVLQCPGLGTLLASYLLFLFAQRILCVLCSVLPCRTSLEQWPYSWHTFSEAGRPGIEPLEKNLLSWYRSNARCPSCVGTFFQQRTPREQCPVARTSTPSRLGRGKEIKSQFSTCSVTLHTDSRRVCLWHSKPAWWGRKRWQVDRMDWKHGHCLEVRYYVVWEKKGRTALVSDLFEKCITQGWIFQCNWFA